jgi:hypothetical protein
MGSAVAGILKHLIGITNIAILFFNKCTFSGLTAEYATTRTQFKTKLKDFELIRVRT